MLRADPTNSMTAESFRDLIRAVEPSAVLIEPRILRRVVRLDRRLNPFGRFGPNRKVYPIDRDRLLVFADIHELEVPATETLPSVVILLARAGDDEPMELVTREQTLQYYWRNLFRARVQVHLEQLAARHGASVDLAAERRRRIGETEFAEIRAVLQKDEFLFPHSSDWEVYMEFVETYLDLRYFAEQDLSWYFPAIRDWQAIDAMVSADVDHRRLFQETRLLESGPQITAEVDEPAPPAVTAEMGDDWSGWSRKGALRGRARRATSAGNDIKAAILLTRLSRTLPAGRRTSIEHEIEDCLHRVASRLQPVFELTPEGVDEWFDALKPLLVPAARSKQFWSAEARILYDLQKVCVEHERGVFRINLWNWARSGGKQPTRYPLPLLRQVLIAKHLRSAARRLPGTRISISARKRFSELLEATVTKVEHQTRDQIRPRILDVFHEVGLRPSNVPESVAQRKVVEELLDRIVEKGAINLGNLRDAISKNDLKLPDLVGSELFQGDRLLRADRRLGRVLDGVYRQGAIYLRWAQRLSSLAFGTRLGRFATRYLVLPYGGAYLAVEGLRHLTLLITGKAEPPSVDEIGHVVFADPEVTRHVAWPAVLILGTWLALLMHWPQFRRWSLNLFTYLIQKCRDFVVELPAVLLRLRWVHTILRSPLYQVIRLYFLQPLLMTVFVTVLFRFFDYRLPAHRQLEIFLVLTALLNSPIGRFGMEWLGDALRRIWNDLRLRVFAAVFQWTMDMFHRLMGALEQLVYTVDEWLRFRTGDNRQVEVVKLLAGTCWFLISYVIVFVFTLLLEPQVNPIKHFPVVTVSHKLILPTGPTFVEHLTPYVGKARANTIVWSTIWLIPGVFGFLVWELKENWRLYASNRRPILAPAPFGHHGETMIRMLRPGIHSGTLPKQFAPLRKYLRKAQFTGQWLRARQQRNVIHRAEEDVRRFVERDFLALLHEGGFPEPWIPHVQNVHAATNRVDVYFHSPSWSQPASRISWSLVDGTMTGCVEGDFHRELLSDQQRSLLERSMAALFQRTGTDEVRGPVPVSLTPPLAWDPWVALW